MEEKNPTQVMPPNNLSRKLQLCVQFLEFDFLSSILLHDTISQLTNEFQNFLTLKQYSESTSNIMLKCFYMSSI